jgi:hypothetical protein
MKSSILAQDILMKPYPASCFTERYRTGTIALRQILCLFSTQGNLIQSEHKLDTRATPRLPLVLFSIFIPIKCGHGLIFLTLAQV